ncbi:NACHT domain-containing protein [Streptomyces sp. S1]|uniref:NACHT domain-containing protein n=1 Tax=Streptomyces sp. S1 TaxID=718288 RepID=UPI003D72789D
MGFHRETLYRRLRALRIKAEATYRERHGSGGLQAPLEQQVRKTGLPGTSTFEGKVASRWAPKDIASFNTPQPDSFEQVLAVVAVWESWTDARTLDSDGRVRPAWLASEARRDWQRLLDSAWQETANGRRRTPTATGMEAEADAAVARYFERLVVTCGRLNLDVLGGSERAGEQPKIRLRQVFEAPPASWDPPKPELPARLWQELVERGEVPAEELPPGLRAEQVKEWRRTRVERPPVPVLEAVSSAQGQRLVLLGDPGAGKSTLSRFLALAIAGGLEEVPAELRGLVEAGTVPVVIELRHLADERWRGRTVEDFWEEFDSTERMCLPRNVFEYLLERTHRPVLVVFDGLDEIFDPGRRAAVARQVAAFAEVHEHVRVIVTSRVIGFTGEVFANAGFAQAKLEDLPRRQIESFIRRWYIAAHCDDLNEASRLSERLINAVRGFTSVAELAGNPLLLTILASIGLGTTIPRDRREVYRHAVDVLTSRWDRDAKHLPLPRQDHPDVAAAIDELDMGLLQELLQRLARRLQESAGSPEGSPLIPRGDLTDMIAEYVVTDMNYPQHVGRIVAGAVVTRLHERAFLLHPHGAGMYGFVHRTFLEYLAARELNRRYAGREWSPEELIDMLADRATNPVWHEVILLFIGEISSQAEAEHATFIARLLHMHRRRSTHVYHQKSGSTKFLELAIRVLAEAHRIPRAPARPGKHPEKSLAIQSNAVIDTLTAHLSEFPWAELNGAVPAMMSFPWSWTGRERYQRWYRTEIPSDSGNGKDVLAASLCRTPQEAGRLAQVPWGYWAGNAAVRVLGERWPDRDETYTAILNTARNTNAGSYARTAALQLLGERWPDRDDTYTTILEAARDKNNNDTIRDSALEVLGERWHDRDDAYTTVLDTVHDTDTSTPIRDVALQVLAKRWPNRDDTYTTILEIARNRDSNSRDVAVRALGEQWPDRDDTYTTVLEVARDNNDNASDYGRGYACSTALEVLEEQWPDRDDTYTTVLEAARDKNNNNNDTQVTALQLLGERWADQNDTYTTVLEAARDNNNNDTQVTALQLLWERWPDRDETYTAILNTIRNTNAGSYARTTSLRLLGERWPDRDDTYTTILEAARDNNAGNTIRDSALEVLGERWHDRDDAYTTVLDTVHDTDTSTPIRDVALQVLAKRWPNRDDTYTTILEIARNRDSNSRDVAVRALGEQWPDRDDTYTTVLEVARDNNDNASDYARITALRLLGEQWPDREDAYTTVLETARNTSDNGTTRSTALQMLAQWWPDRDDTYITVLETARNTSDNGTTRDSALYMLAQRWPDLEAAWDCAVIHFTEKGKEVTDSLLKTLTLAWSEKSRMEEFLLKLAKEQPDNTVINSSLSYLRSIALE